KVSTNGFLIRRSLLAWEVVERLVSTPHVVLKGVMRRLGPTWLGRSDAAARVAGVSHRPVVRQFTLIPRLDERVRHRPCDAVLRRLHPGTQSWGPSTSAPAALRQALVPPRGLV